MTSMDFGGPSCGNERTDLQDTQKGYVHQVPQPSAERPETKIPSEVR